ncbi:MAG: hypothetical protein ABJQ14_10910, partial [Hyphomicrobiales bacterium]
MQERQGSGFIDRSFGCIEGDHRIAAEKVCAGTTPGVILIDDETGHLFAYRVWRHSYRKRCIAKEREGVWA